MNRLRLWAARILAPKGWSIVRHDAMRVVDPIQEHPLGPLPFGGIQTFSSCSPVPTETLNGPSTLTKWEQE